MVGQLGLFRNSREPYRQSRVMKVELWTFNVSLGDVAVPRSESIEDETAFQNGKPFTCRRLGDSGIRSETVEIHDLTDPTGTQADESLKKTEVFDLSFCVGLLREDRPDKGGLPGLPRPS